MILDCGDFRVQRGGVRRGDGEIFVSVDPATPARLRGGDAAAGESPGLRQELSPGLLDLHAFDTELIPDVRRELHFFYKILLLLFLMISRS
jgi:kinesin family protein 2/24